MPPPLPLRPVQNHSFKSQDLAREDFSSCNLRGCNFLGAILTEANFQRVFTAQSWSQVIARRAIVIVSAVIVPLAVGGACGYPPALHYGMTITVFSLFALPVVFIFAQEPYFKNHSSFCCFCVCCFCRHIWLSCSNRYEINFCL